MRTARLLLTLALTPPAAAQDLPARSAMFGHLAYAEADEVALVPAPPGFALGQRCLVQPTLLPDLGRMLAAAATAGVTLRGLSCYRGYAHQHAAFCRHACDDVGARAHLVAPPGYSEHATGYAIDFGERPARGCADVSPCFAATDAGRWLATNAPGYGFELSFPPDNAQGVAWEPWHWRWVGADAAEAGAGAARSVFERARIGFPASPAVAPLLARIASQPPVPAPIPVPAPAPSRRRRR